MSARSCSLVKCWWSAATRRCSAFRPLPGATVAAEVLDHKRGPKVIAFKKRRRKNSRRKRGYRDEITVIRVTEILTDGKTPSIGPRPKREKAPAKAKTEDEATQTRLRSRVGHEKACKGLRGIGQEMK